MPAVKCLRAVFVVGLLITGLAFISTVSPAYAQDVSPRKADKIRELIKLSNADKMIEAMMPMVTEQLQMSIKANLPNAPQKHIDVMVEAMKEEMRSSTDIFFELMIPQYSSLLSEETIDDTITFYKTPSGQKLAEANPHFTTIGSKVGQQWGLMIAPKAAKRAMKKARELGYEF
ncbi:DUF2059 domain-containing protein [Thalassospira tepidiphila]|jgi:uncharacterized protein|uniref:DUF2059 domain-containing protein n=1 Tax=Thalassospira tepidiphila TaxID=393657 RepID=UPI001BD04220|nr:DUF2059 domain-containing protein [Thalassospira tepidiphila]MBS8274724.1 DUF2059 domain-containing protein [Thalassospira tepidiphila]